MMRGSGVSLLAGVLSMKYAIVAGTWASFSRAVAAAAIGTWLAFAVCPVVFAADGPQAAAAAKESMEAFIDYAKSLARSGGRPDYSKSPVAEHFRKQAISAGSPTKQKVQRQASRLSRHSAPKKAAIPIGPSNITYPNTRTRSPPRWHSYCACVSGRSGQG